MNFAIKSGKLVGDWQLLKSRGDSETMCADSRKLPADFL